MATMPDICTARPRVFVSWGTADFVVKNCATRISGPRLGKDSKGKLPEICFFRAGPARRSNTVRLPACLASARTGTANLRTNIMDFRGFDPIFILTIRGGILMSIGKSPVMFDSCNVSGDNDSEIGRTARTGTTLATWLGGRWTASELRSSADEAVFDELLYACLIVMICNHINSTTSWLLSLWIVLSSLVLLMLSLCVFVFCPPPAELGAGLRSGTSCPPPAGGSIYLSLSLSLYIYIYNMETF